MHGLSHDLWNVVMREFDEWLAADDFSDIARHRVELEFSKLHFSKEESLHFLDIEKASMSKELREMIKSLVVAEIKE